MTINEAITKETNWHRKAILIERFHLLARVHYGKKWTIKKTAGVLKLSVGHISEDLQLSKAFNINPELAKLSSRNLALKALRSSSHDSK